MTEIDIELIGLYSNLASLVNSARGEFANLKEELDEAPAVVNDESVDTEELLRIRGAAEAILKEVKVAVAQIEEALSGAEPDKKHARTINRVKRLLDEDSGIPAFIAEINSKLPTKDLMASLTKDELIKIALESIKEFRESDEPLTKKDHLAMLEMVLTIAAMGGEPETVAPTTTTDVKAASPKVSKERVEEKKKKLKLAENFDQKTERLGKVAKETQEGNRGGKVARAVDRVWRFGLTKWTAENKKRKEQLDATTKVFKIALPSIKNEFTFRNVVKDFATGGIQGVEVLSHRNDLLAFAKFLKKVNLIDGYDAEKLGELKASEESVNTSVGELEKRYDTTPEAEAYEKDFVAYVKEQAHFLAPIFGGKPTKPEAVAAVGPARAEVKTAAAPAASKPAKAEVKTAAASVSELEISKVATDALAALD